MAQLTMYIHAIGTKPVLFQWLDGAWHSAYDVENAEQLNATKQALRRTLVQYTGGGGGGQDLLTREAVVKELIDEHATTLFVRVVNRLFEALETIRENVTKDELLPGRVTIFSLKDVLDPCEETTHRVVFLCSSGRG